MVRLPRNEKQTYRFNSKASNVTIMFDLDHNLDLWIFKVKRDLDFWPHTWPRPWIFMVKFLNSCISEWEGRLTLHKWGGIRSFMTMTMTIWWSWSGVWIYQRVTGVTSVVGVPSTHLVYYDLWKLGFLIWSFKPILLNMSFIHWAYWYVEKGLGIIIVCIWWSKNCFYLAWLLSPWRRINKRYKRSLEAYWGKFSCRKCYWPCITVISALWWLKLHTIRLLIKQPVHNGTSASMSRRITISCIG